MSQICRTPTGSVLVLILLQIWSADYALAMAQTTPPDSRAVDALLAYKTSVARFGNVSYCLDYRTRWLANGKVIDLNHIQYPLAADGSAHYINLVFTRTSCLDLIELKPEFAADINKICDPQAYLRRTIVDGSGKVLAFTGPFLPKTVPAVTLHTEGGTAEEVIDDELASAGTGACVLLGRQFRGSSNCIPDLMLSGHITLNEHDKDGFVDVESALQDCTLRVNLDPTIGFQPRSISQIHSDKEPTGVDLSCSDIEYSGTGKDAHCTKASIAIHQLVSVGQALDIKTEVSMSDVNFNPDFEKVGAFRMVAPSNTAFVNLDNPNIPIGLKDGKPEILVGDGFEADVANVVKEAGRIALQQHSTDQKAAATYWVGIIVTFLILSCLLIYTWFKRRLLRGR